MTVAKKYNQLAWVVEDLDEAVRQWQDAAGIGPWFTADHVGGIMVGAELRGDPIEVDISVAVAQAGPVQIELIKQHGGAPSPYRDVYAEGEGGFHHVCSFVEDVEEECRTYEKLGYPVVMRAMLAGQTPVAYVDTRALLGCMTELMEGQGLVVGMFEGVAAAAEGWDGTDPVRDLTSLMG